MAAATEYTDEQKAAFVALALKKGRGAAGKKAGVSNHTISTWAKTIGVKFTSGKKAAAKKTPRARANGKANGHAAEVTNGSAPPIVATEEAPSFDALHAQLTAALKSVAAMKAAFRRTFG